MFKVSEFHMVSVSFRGSMFNRGSMFVRLRWFLDFDVLGLWGFYRVSGL
jgi:hypothetical protein